MKYIKLLLIFFINSQVLVMPLAGDEYSMVLTLQPSAVPVGVAPAMSKKVSELTPTKLLVALPRFNVVTYQNLQQALPKVRFFNFFSDSITINSSSLSRYITGWDQTSFINVFLRSRQLTIPPQSSTLPDLLQSTSVSQSTSSFLWSASTGAHIWI